MICRACAYANTPHSTQRPRTNHSKRILHARCRGGSWCDCQHVVGRQTVDREKRDK